MASPKNVRGHFIDLRHHISFKTNVQIGKIFVEVNLKFRIRHFVAGLVLSVVFIFFLDRVIGQMDQAIVKIVHVVFVGTCSDIPFVKNISFGVAADRAHNGKCPDIKFSPVDQQWVMDILLNYTGPSFIRLIGFCNNFHDFIKIFGYLDAISTICVFSRFYDPGV